ncbi:hypothetical protein [Bradyrhizobium sp. 23AC]
MPAKALTTTVRKIEWLKIVTKRFDCNQVALDGTNARGGFLGYVMHCVVMSELVDRNPLRVSQIRNCTGRIGICTNHLIKKRWVPNRVHR